MSLVLLVFSFDVLRQVDGKLTVISDLDCGVAYSYTSGVTKVTNVTKVEVDTQ